jgi:uncharacterized protein
MPDVVICNTSPLFYLHRLGRLDLLQKLYVEVTVPQAVVGELRAGREQGEDTPDPTRIEWIEIRTVQVPALITLITDFGPGEAEVLSMALEKPGSLVILDDKLARTVAKARELRVTGTGGLLLRAKEQGHLSTVAPLLADLVRLGFRLSPAATRNILDLAGE